MIVRMKELLLFTLSSKVDDTVQMLGKLGVVDIQQINPAESEQLAVRKARLESARQAIDLIHAHNGKDKEQLPLTAPLYDPKELVNKVLEAQQTLERAKKQMGEQQQALEFYHTWGEHFRIQDLEYLKNKGLYLRLYLTDKELQPSQTRDHSIIYLDRQKGKIPLVLIGRSAD